MPIALLLPVLPLLQPAPAIITLGVRPGDPDRAAHDRIGSYCNTGIWSRGPHLAGETNLRFHRAASGPSAVPPTP